MSEAVKIVAILSYNIALFVGAAYLVVQHDWSAWTMCLPFLAMMQWKKDKGELTT